MADLRMERTRLGLSRASFILKMAQLGQRVISDETLRKAEDGRRVMGISAQAIIDTLNELSGKKFTFADFPDLWVARSSRESEEDEEEDEPAFAS